MSTVGGKLFVSLEEISGVTGIPERWLKSQAEQGNIPVLRIPGKALLFNVGLTEAALLRLVMPAQQDDAATPPTA